MSSVTVLNLVFPSTPSKPIHPPGFGYLVPRPPTGYEDAQDPGILGTVFDSCAILGQDGGDDDNRLTKLTVMIGGPYHHHYDTITPVSTILNHLASQLSHQTANRLPEPLLCRMHRHMDCIPMLGVGHLDRMKELSAALEGEPWVGRLKVIGAGVGGVSVGDCVRAGRDVGKEWV